MQPKLPRYWALAHARTPLLSCLELGLGWIAIANASLFLVTFAEKPRACSAGYKPTLLQLFGLLQLQSIERKIL
jgi:hypothetical protein